MKKIYKAKNISCESCVNLIKVSLEDDFPDIEVNLDVNPKEITVTITSDEEEKLFKTQMDEIGFPIIE